MLPIAGQTAGPNGLTFFVGTHGCCKLKIELKKKFLSIVTLADLALSITSIFILEILYVCGIGPWLTEFM